MALTTANLNVITMYRVIADFQRIQPGTLAFANFQTIEIIGGAIRQRAPFVQLFMVAGRNNAAVADQYRRCVNNGAFQEVAQFGEIAHFFTQRLYRRAVNGFKLSVQFRQLLEGVTHSGEIARTRGAQRQTRKDTLQIADLTQHRLQFADGVLQGADGLLAFTQYVGISYRHMQPAFKHSATHWRHGTVKHRGEGIFDTTGQVLGNFQIAAGRGIHNDAVLLAFHRNGTNMRQGGALGIFYVL